MNRSKFMTLLLLANLCLLAAAAYFYRQAQGGKANGSRAGAEAAQLDGPAHPSLRLLKVVKTNILETNAFRWTQLESADYAAYIKRLRAIGCPEQTIRDLIIADIDKLFAPRLHAVTPGARPLPYWQPDEKELESEADHRERRGQQRQIDFQKREVVRQLLGIDLVSERAKVRAAEDYTGRRLGFLSDENRSRVRMILEESNDAELAIRQKTWAEGEPLSEEDRSHLNQVQQDRDAAIARALSPAEWEQYQLAMSPLAYEVRDSLFGMNPSEQEYVGLYRLQKEFQEQWPDGASGPADPAKRAEWEQAQAGLQARLKEQLGETRYAEYVRAQDPDYRQLAITAARFQLPAGTAADVYEYKRVVQEARAKVTGNRSLTADQQRSALEGMASETSQTLKDVLGPKAFDYYLRTGEGAWLRAPAAP